MILYIFLLIHIHPIYADESSITINVETSQINEIQENKSKLLIAKSEINHTYKDYDSLIFNLDRSKPKAFV